jgi:hypothetical protein
MPFFKRRFNAARELEFASRKKPEPREKFFQASHDNAAPLSFFARTAHLVIGNPRAGLDPTTFFMRIRPQSGRKCRSSPKGISGPI